MNSILVLVDYQPVMIKSVASGDKTIIKSAAVYAAKAAKYFGCSCCFVINQS